MAATRPEAAYIGDNQSTWMTTTVTGPGTISFWYAVSSETSHDYFEFYVDNNLISRRSGNTAWGLSEVFVPVGTHTAKWVYVKDVFVFGGALSLEQITHVYNYGAAGILSASYPGKMAPGSLLLLLDN